ncbi:MAG: HU family DNA-binding protein [Acidobacteria bacterium]|nr:HU family DNA-binding protein [Acidobacteriota bacterium]
MSKSEFKPDRYFLGLLVKAGFTRKQSNEIFNLLFTHICDTLLEGKATEIKGFGTFRVYSKTTSELDAKSDNLFDNQKEKVIRFYPSSAFKLLIENIAQPKKTNILAKKISKKPLESTVSAKNLVLPSISNLAKKLTKEDEDEEFPTLPDEELEQISLAIRDDLAKEEITPEQRNADFDLHYNIGIAYKEMALYSLAIEDLAKAVSVIEGHLFSKETRSRYVQCCEILSLCFSALGNFADAEKWLLNGLRLTSQTENQYKALRYDLALIYEATDRIEEATEAFFDVYAIDINFRRVAQKLKTLQSRYIKRARDERKSQLIPVLVRGKTVTGERFEEETLIVNVSRRGAGLRISYEPQQNSFLELRFSDAQRVKLAKIIWCSPASNPTGGFQAGVLIYHELPNSKK